MSERESYFERKYSYVENEEFPGDPNAYINEISFRIPKSIATQLETDIRLWLCDEPTKES